MVVKLFDRCSNCLNRLYCCYDVLDTKTKKYKLHYHCFDEFKTRNKKALEMQNT